MRSAFEAISHEVSASVPYLAGTRRKLLDRYPYFVVFREESEAIQVIAVAHGRRLPGYWKNRV
uniref:Plasmid stabilization system protein n=1 Tax=mine drainage metagenome TaxID=410659 RepID=E6Q016_9ZZZZ